MKPFTKEEGASCAKIVLKKIFNHRFIKITQELEDSAARRLLIPKSKWFDFL